MSATPLMSHRPSEGHVVVPPADGVAPRLADGDEQPVESPVHALQRELERFDSLLEMPPLQLRKAPGWVRLGLPVALSAGLWIVIFELFSALR